MNWDSFQAAESGGFQQHEKGQTDSRYHTGDEKKDRSEARLLIDFRKATGPTHTHTLTFPCSHICRLP